MKELAYPGTVNVKFLGLLVASLFVLAFGVVYVHAYQIQRNAGIFKRQAQQAEEGSRLDEAAKYYFLYLGYRPDDTEARIAWARVLERKSGKSQRDLRRLYDVYEAVLRRQPELNEIRRNLVNVAVAMQRFSDAREHLDHLLGGFSQDETDPKRLRELGELEQLFALCCAAKNENAKAEIIYRAAVKHAPEHLPSYVQLAQLYTRWNRLAKDKRPSDADNADKIMEDLVKAKAGDYQAHLARARYLRQRRQLETMGKEIEQAYALAPDKPEPLMAMADLSQERQQIEAARTYLQHGLEKFKDNAAIYLALAQLERDARRPEEAIACLRSGLKEVPVRNRNALYHMLGLSLVQHGLPDETREVDDVIKALVKGRAPQAMIEELNARILISKLQWAEAAAILEKMPALVSADPQSVAQVYLLLGICYEKRGEPDRALNAYKQALAANAHLPAARTGVATALAALGRPEDALGEYQAVLAEDPTVGTKLARLLIRRNLRWDKTKRDWKGVEQALAAAEKAEPGSTEVVLVRVEALLAQEENAQAQELIAKSCKAQPAKTELWLAWADLTDAVAKNPARALEILQEAKTKIGDRVELRLGEAWYWQQRLAKGGEQAATALRLLEDNTDHLTPEDHARLCRGLGDVYAGARNSNQAKRLWSQAAALLPQDLAIRLTLFDLAIQEKDENAMANLMDEIKRLDSEGTMWRYTRAMGLITSAGKGNRRGLAEARQLLVEVATRRKLWGAPIRNLAAIDDLEGNQQQALERYEQALQLGDRNPMALRRTMQLLWERQRFTEANQILQKMEDQGTLTWEGRKARALFLNEQGDHESAIALAREIVASGSKDLRDQVLLGQLLWAGGEKYYREAEDTLRKAVQAPEAGQLREPWVALVQFLAATGQKPQAFAVIAEARRKLAAETATLALAQCYEALDEIDKAAAEFDAALKKNPVDLDVLRNVASFHLRHGRLSKAEPYLRKLLEPQTQATERDLAWARRALALHLSNSTDPQRFQEARQLLEENLHGGGSMEDLRTLAVLLAAHPQTRREAVNILENLPGGQKPTVEQRFIQAMLYEVTRNWTQARQAFNTLASNALAEPEPRLNYVAYSARALLRHGEVGEAGVWLKKLEQLDADALQTLDVRVRFFKAQARLAEAAALLKEYLQKPDANLEAAAGLFEEIGRPADAEQLYRKLTHQASAPQKNVVLARFLARQGRTDEALEICEQIAGTGARNQAADAALAALRGGQKPAAAQVRRVEKLLDDALKHDPGSVIGLLQLASLREMQQNFPAAEAAYRQVLKHDARSMVALNNLAWLLGFQPDKTQEALSLINRALESSGKWPELLDTRAVLYLKLGDSKNAMADLDLAILEAEMPALYFHRAQALRFSNRSAAKASLRKAYELKLTRASLHPLEQQAYNELVAALEEK